MAFKPASQKFNAAINTVEIGCGDKKIALGGECVLPFYTFDAPIENAPKVGVELTDLGTAVAEGTQEAIDKAREELIAGTIHTFDISTFTVDGKALESYEADVDTDADYTPDHEVVSDGYFHESGSEFRSAPYFDVQIDGITLLDTKF